MYCIDGSKTEISNTVLRKFVCPSNTTTCPKASNSNILLTEAESPINRLLTIPKTSTAYPNDCKYKI